MKKKLVKKFIKNIKEPLKNSYWRFYGYFFIKPWIKPKLPTNSQSFLFLCKGNICRSVFAQGLAIKIADEKRIPNLVFDSVGLEVTKALPPPQEALIVARELGVSLDDYRSKQISLEAVKYFDVLITMEAKQLETLKNLFPQWKDKFFLLPLFNDNRANIGDYFSLYNIKDPFGKDLAQFRICYKNIESCLLGLFNQLTSKTEN